MTKVQANPLSDEELEIQLPTPVGYHLLIAMPVVDKTFGDSLVEKAISTINEETIMSIIGIVLDMGRQAYSDPERFPDGPWCERGDYVMFRANSGTRFKINGAEYRLMNDDSIEAIITDPSGITRA
jgi:co-chaperonin GroES (HSP10)